MAGYDEYFPIQLSDRPLRFGGDVLRSSALAQAELKRLLADHRAVTQGLLVNVAHACFQIEHVRANLGISADRDEGSSASALEIIAADLRETLDEYDIRIVDLSGQDWDPEWRDMVDIRGHHVRDDLAAARIAHMELPIVHRGRELVARGAVILEGPRRG